MLWRVTFQYECLESDGVHYGTTATGAVEAWVRCEYMRVAGECQALLKKYPNPPGLSMPRFAVE